MFQVLEAAAGWSFHFLCVFKNNLDLFASIAGAATYFHIVEAQVDQHSNFVRKPHTNILLK